MASAPGIVVPVGDITIIQHLEGGIIQKINVREGDRVSAGDPLLQLSLGAQTLNRAELQAKLDALRLSRARYEAQARGAELDFPADAARRTELASTQSGLRNAARQRELEVEEFLSRGRSLLRELENVNKNLNAVQEKYGISADLLEQGLTTRAEHLELEQDILEFEKEIAFSKAIWRSSKWRSRAPARPWRKRRSVSVRCG